MTNEEIAELAGGLLYDVRIDGGKVWFAECFTTDEDHDAGDVSWDLRSDVRDRLADVGLEPEDMDSDNDTLWGTIVGKAPVASNDYYRGVAAGIRSTGDGVKTIMANMDAREEARNQRKGSFVQVKLKRHQVSALYVAIGRMDGLPVQAKGADGQPAGVILQPYEMEAKAVFAMARTRSSVRDEVAAYEEAQKHVLNGVNGSAGLDARNVANKGLVDLGNEEVEVGVYKVDVKAIKDVGKVPPSVLCDLMPMLEGEL